MTFAWLVHLAMYASLAMFAVMIVARVIKYATAPMHVRWEIYPIPHEKGRDHGGSYFEETDWWTRSRRPDRLAEVRAMVGEMLLIRVLWHHNRAQWYASFPFHVGLYLLSGLALLLLAGAGVEVAGFVVGPQSPAAPLVLLHYLTIAVGLVGLLSATAGAIGLLLRRSFDGSLRVYSSPSDYFNLLFLLVVFASLWGAWIGVDPTFSLLRGFLRHALTLSAAQTPGPILLEVLLISIFLAYLPFTHMTHFVGKFFTWHQVRWDDAPNLKGSPVSRRILGNLARPVSWSAPHIRGGKSWAEVATEE